MNGLMVSHLKFADDTLITCKDWEDQVLNLSVLSDVLRPCLS